MADERRPAVVAVLGDPGGAELARALAGLGAVVVLVAAPGPAAAATGRALAEAVETGGRGAVVVADGPPGAVADLVVEVAAEQFGGLDAAVVAARPVAFGPAVAAALSRVAAALARADRNATGPSQAGTSA